MDSRSDALCKPESDGKPYSGANCDGNRHGGGNSLGKSDSNSHSYGNRDRKPNSDGGRYRVSISVKYSLGNRLSHGRSDTRNGDELADNSRCSGGDIGNNRIDSSGTLTEFNFLN
jgi:hypothetical protein